MRKERQLTDHELSRPAVALAKRFVQRWDLHTRQLNDGRYICIHAPLTVDHLFAHLRGEITLGAYLLNQESQARFIVFDADDDHGFARLARLASALEDNDVPSYLESSRRGGHLWLFLAQAVPGRCVRTLAQGMLSAHRVEDVEVFPKQDELGGGPGSLIRMPFGVHRLTDYRYGFYYPNGSPLAQTIKEQIYILSSPKMVPGTAFEAYYSYVPSELPSASPEGFRTSTDTLSNRIKASITVLEFLSQYADLKPTNNGAIGLCPFHDDHHPSLSVNDRDNYWHCFAGCGGGSVIDFYIKWRSCDFATAVTELADMLF